MANQEIDTLNQIVHSIDILLVSQKNKIKKIKLKKKNSEYNGIPE